MRSTHRQRTQGYIKELENEVLRLRDAEKQTIHKVAKLQQDVNLLLAILTKHSIPTPPGIVNQFSQPGKEERYVELHALPNPIAAMVNLKDPPCSESSNYTPPVMTISSRSEAASPMLSSTIYTSDVSDSLTSSRNYVQPTLFEDPRVGIDFVLAYVLLVYSYLLYTACSHYITGWSAPAYPICERATWIIMTELNSLLNKPG